MDAGIPKRYADASMECTEYADELERGTSIYVHGTIGDGKTYFACSLIKELLKRGASAGFASSCELLSETFENRTVLDERVKNRRIVVIDDIGKEITSGFAASRLFGYIDRRYRDVKPTVFTCNLTPSELSDRLSIADPSLGRAALSRMLENCDVVEMGTNDRRRLWDK